MMLNTYRNMKNITTNNVFEDIGFYKQEAAALLGINQSEVSALMHDHIFKFSIDALVNMQDILGKHQTDNLVN